MQTHQQDRTKLWVEVVPPLGGEFHWRRWRYPGPADDQFAWQAALAHPTHFLGVPAVVASHESTQGRNVTCSNEPTPFRPLSGPQKEPRKASITYRKPDQEADPTSLLIPAKPLQSHFRLCQTLRRIVVLARELFWLPDSQGVGKAVTGLLDVFRAFTMRQIAIS